MILRPPPHAFSRAALLAALALAGCLGSYEREVEATRAGLIGKTGRELRECLGVPTDFDQRGDVELLRYRFDYTRTEDVMPPITRRGVGGYPVPGRPPREHDKEGFCQLDFELDAKGVTKVTALGRDDDGMRANSECMLRAQHCVDERYAE